MRFLILFRFAKLKRWMEMAKSFSNTKSCLWSCISNWNKFCNECYNVMLHFRLYSKNEIQNTMMWSFNCFLLYRSLICQRIHFECFFNSGTSKFERSKMILELCEWVWLNLVSSSESPESIYALIFLPNIQELWECHVHINFICMVSGLWSFGFTFQQSYDISYVRLTVGFKVTWN